jgi:hypothetical protein
MLKAALNAMTVKVEASPDAEMVRRRFMYWYVSRMLKESAAYVHYTTNLSILSAIALRIYLSVLLCHQHTRIIRRRLTIDLSRVLYVCVRLRSETV